MPKEIINSKVPASADSLAAAALMGDDPVPLPESATPTDVTAESIDKTPNPALEASTPAERWRKALKDANMDEEKACRILDAFVGQGFYSEEFVLMGGRVKVVLRTRDSENRARVVRAVDRLMNPTQVTVWEVTNQYNLAGSLNSYWRKGMPDPVVLPFPIKGTSAEDAAEMFDKRMAFIFSPPGLPDPVLSAIYARLATFDQQVFAALSDGAASGF